MLIPTILYLKCSLALLWPLPFFGRGPSPSFPVVSFVLKRRAVKLKVFSHSFSCCSQRHYHHSPTSKCKINHQYFNCYSPVCTAHTVLVGIHLFAHSFRQTNIFPVIKLLIYLCTTEYNLSPALNHITMQCLCYWCVKKTVKKYCTKYSPIKDLTTII